ncbi:MAG: AraC family transcriptional regulator [Sedimentisphaeraceae bacterium JB056]
MKIKDAGYGSGEGFWKHHHEDQWEIHLFISGQGLYENEQQQRQIATGMLTYSRPFEKHCCSSDEGLTDFYYIGFEFEDMDNNLKESVDGVFQKHDHLMLDRTVFSEFGRIIQKSRTENLSIIKSSEHLFASLLYELVANNSKNYVAESNDLASSLLDILHRSTYDKVGLDEIAEKMGFDKSYLIRVFKQKYNITPIKYLLKLKIDAACYLLEHSQLNIKEIAFQLKFYDEYYFSRKFKEIKKCSPKKYRNNCKNNHSVPLGVNSLGC